MKKLMMWLVGMGVLVTFLAFTKTNPVMQNGQAKLTWQDTIPFRHYSDGRNYIDPNSGDTIDITMDHSTHKLMNRRNNTEVTIYVDPASSDTFYGEGYVVNNLIVKMPDGKYKLDSTKVKIDGNKVKYKQGDTKGKVKIEDDKIKAKDGDEKTKLKKKGDSVKVKKG